MSVDLGGGRIIKKPVLGGGGGGRKDMAQAGGKNPGKAPEAVEAALRIISDQVG